ncbi:hypothetical protein LOAG_11688 [Loa loa]|uniref:Uncharacterized protein n=1 Tax=Loa loa TaxID=7209 RepID=A0A1S0TN49_LOALO|nr:hypothetical protein LOAG_11688 [Loa loa]EFO16813.2 hypothetical protein LOAG_11688 [Loa loa]
MNGNTNGNDIQSSKNVYTKTSISYGITDNSSKRRGKLCRQRHNTQHERINQQHSTILQTRILSGNHL